MYQHEIRAQIPEMWLALEVPTVPQTVFLSGSHKPPWAKQ